MPNLNSLNQNISLSTGLTWSSFSGQFPLSNFGTNGTPSASNYYMQTGGILNINTPTLTANIPGWAGLPYITPGPQGALAVMGSNVGFGIQPYVGLARSVVQVYKNNGLSNWAVSTLQLGDGQFGNNTNNSTTSATAGNFVGANGFIVQNGSNSVSIGYTYPVTTVTGTSATMANNSTYITNNASRVTLTLPATITSGARYLVVGLGAGGWRIAQNAGQSIRIGESVTTTGIGGRVDSANATDCIMLVGVSTTQVVALCAPASSGLTIV